MFDLTAASSSSSSGSLSNDASSPPPPPPPQPDYAPIDVNLRGAVDTLYLARHFMLRSPEPDKGAIVVTASCSSVWPTFWAPIYTASKCKLTVNFVTKNKEMSSKSLRNTDFLFFFSFNPSRHPWLHARHRGPVQDHGWDPCQRTPARCGEDADR